jgi:HNH endonuclease
VVSILERGGRPLSVGRKTRSVPPALRRALASRDHGCRFPGCGQTRFLHAHHIEHWARGGQTELANLVQLCAYHHRLIHEGGYGLTRGRDQTLIFRRPDGRPIPPAPAPTAGRPARLHADNRRHGLDITSDTTSRRWDGGRLDLALAIDGLVWADPRLNDANASPTTPMPG